MEDVCGRDNFTGLYGHLECRLNGLLRGETIVLQPVPGEVGKAPKIKTIDLAFSAEIKIDFTGRQKYRATVPMFEIAYATGKLPSLRNVVPNPVDWGCRPGNA